MKSRNVVILSAIRYFLETFRTESASPLFPLDMCVEGTVRSGIVRVCSSHSSDHLSSYWRHVLNCMCMQVYGLTVIKAWESFRLFIKQRPVLKNIHFNIKKQNTTILLSQLRHSVLFIRHVTSLHVSAYISAIIRCYKKNTQCRLSLRIPTDPLNLC
jgi:hypothetical protein